MRRKAKFPAAPVWPMWWVGPPRTLIAFGTEALEVLGRCSDCGVTMVRSCNKTAVSFHLAVPPNMIQLLRN